MFTFKRSPLWQERHHAGVPSLLSVCLLPFRGSFPLLRKPHPQDVCIPSTSEEHYAAKHNNSQVSLGSPRFFGKPLHHQILSHTVSIISHQDNTAQLHHPSSLTAAQQTSCVTSRSTSGTAASASNSSKWPTESSLSRPATSAPRTTRRVPPSAPSTTTTSTTNATPASGQQRRNRRLKPKSKATTVAEAAAPPSGHRHRLSPKSRKRARETTGMGKPRNPRDQTDKRRIRRSNG